MNQNFVRLLKMEKGNLSIEMIVYIALAAVFLIGALMFTLKVFNP